MGWDDPRASSRRRHHAGRAAEEALRRAHVTWTVSCRAFTMAGMEPIFGRNGQVVAWLDPNSARIFALSGEALARIRRGKDVYTFGGKHVGVTVEGTFRDHSGDVVGWLRGSHGGPVRPVPSVPPVPPVPAVPPVSSVPEVPPVPAVRSLGWSRFTFHDWASGRTR